MYVLRYCACGGGVLDFLVCGYGDGSHVKQLFGTDCLWLVPGTLDAKIV